MEVEKLKNRSTWLYNHPKVEKLKDAGISDTNIIITAMTVYIHLIEVCHWFDVEMHPCQKIMKILLTGCRTKQGAEREVFLPIRGDLSFSPKSINDLLEDEFFLRLSDKPSINIAVVSGDSSVLFYKMSNGLLLSEFSK